LHNDYTAITKRLRSESAAIIIAQLLWSDRKRSRSNYESIVRHFRSDCEGILQLFLSDLAELHSDCVAIAQADCAAVAQQLIA
jgi:hypothetical protein